ncbi:hypothetical protein RJ641_018344 [Dillenia turbinata]|uniref:Glyoxysomal processing protease, glyoxysomal n=1 Tax=Dillenia turbinata TaxID=194707 RepID=A0AAN8UXG2_9MAGN
MELPEIVNVARNSAVMVRVQGPDPKGLKMRKHAFHHYDSGKTTLSASGVIWPNLGACAENKTTSFSGSAVIVTVASVVEPFLSVQHRQNISQMKPELIPGTQIDVMMESFVEADSESSKEKTAPHWLPAQLLTLVDVSTSTLALQTLVQASSSSLGNGWEVGWSQSSYGNGPPHLDALQRQAERNTRPFMKRQGYLGSGETSSLSLVLKSTTWVALLGVSSLSFKVLRSLTIMNSINRGDLLLAMGSPFGILSPLHFFNSISVGSVANCCPHSSSDRSLLIADIRCLPGMEGGPVFGGQGHLIGILTRPLRQRNTDAEIQLVIPSEAVAAACGDLLQKELQYLRDDICYTKEVLNSVSANNPDDEGYSHFHNHLSSGYSPQSPIQKAMASVCLITIDDGIWASGILLNKQGLILSNAHLLEPWRFGKTSVSGQNVDKLREIQHLYRPMLPIQGTHGQEERRRSFSRTTSISDPGNDNKKHMMDSLGLSHKRICVRVDHKYPWIWCDARVVFVSQGPLDVALFQLEFVPDQVCPIMVELACPSAGSRAHVIGHGLLGPRCDFSPSVCSGVVAKVIKTKMSHSDQPYLEANIQEDFPAMLETTAVVHPGASGGAIVNSDGCMIGLVTSNARHGAGAVIPHLNFSIPCAALEPIFKFSKDMQNFSLLQDLNKQNEQLSSVWALMPSLSPKPGPSLPYLPRDGKGSRFAKFMADQQEIYRNPFRLGKAEMPPNELIRSKSYVQVLGP